jgi:hypothetical protein
MDDKNKQGHQAPQGTYVLMLIFLALIVLLWSNAFVLQLLSRGGNQ